MPYNWICNLLVDNVTEINWQYARTNTQYLVYFIVLQSIKTSFLTNTGKMSISVLMLMCNGQWFKHAPLSVEWQSLLITPQTANQWYLTFDLSCHNLICLTEMWADRIHVIREDAPRTLSTRRADILANHNFYLHTRILGWRKTASFSSLHQRKVSL